MTMVCDKGVERLAQPLSRPTSAQESDRVDLRYMAHIIQFAARGIRQQSHLTSVMIFNSVDQLTFPKHSLISNKILRKCDG